MEQKIIATVGGHQITEAEVEAFIHSLPREQQAYAAHPDFRKQCEEQLIAVYAFAKYGEEERKLTRQKNSRMLWKMQEKISLHRWL